MSMQPVAMDNCAAVTIPQPEPKTCREDELLIHLQHLEMALLSVDEKLSTNKKNHSLKLLFQLDKAVAGGDPVLFPLLELARRHGEFLGLLARHGVHASAPRFRSRGVSRGSFVDKSITRRFGTIRCYSQTNG